MVGDILCMEVVLFIALIQPIIGLSIGKHSGYHRMNGKRGICRFLNKLFLLYILLLTIQRGTKWPKYVVQVGLYKKLTLWDRVYVPCNLQLSRVFM